MFLLNGLFFVSAISLQITSAENKYDVYVNEIEDELEDGHSTKREDAVVEKRSVLKDDILDSDLMAVDFNTAHLDRDKRTNNARMQDELTMQEKSFTKPQAPISNELTSKLSMTSAFKVKRQVDRVENNNPILPNTKGEISTIFSEIKLAKQNRLSRSDIRKLAKQALMLATIQKVNSKVSKRKKSFKKKTSGKKRTDGKRQAKKSKKKSHTTRSKKAKTSITGKEIKNSNGGKKDAEMSVTLLNIDTDNFKGDIDQSFGSNSAKITDQLMSNNDESMKNMPSEKITPEKITDNSSPSNRSEFSEDLFQEKKADPNDFFSDNSIMELTKIKMSPPTASSASQQQTTPKLQPDGKQQTLQVVNDDGDLNETLPTANATLQETKNSTNVTSITSMNLEDYFTDDKRDAKKDAVPFPQESDKTIDLLKGMLEKANKSKIPERFLTELPAGLRMIAWKELIGKKRKQLNELQARTDISQREVKPVTIDIAINQEPDNSLAEVQKAVVAQKNSVSASAKPTEDVIKNNEPKNALQESNTTEIKNHHVKYLSKHIKSARSLRKLIAKTLIGHCKSTGKKILEAFVAMDKALARAQAIADVIGQKFHVNSDKIDYLVADKEDEVVETFLRDIFTKLN